MSNDNHDILDGKTLKSILEELIEEFGFEKLGQSINIRCFNVDASLNSSLKFLRKTPWARAKVEKLYLKYKKGENV